MASVEAVDVEWLWKGWIARGKLHLICGMPGVGKSYTTCDLAARITRGGTWPDGSQGSDPAEVLFLVGEDGLNDTLRPRLEAHEADCASVHVLRSRTIPGESGKRIERPISLITDIERISELLSLNPAISALVIDPISEYLPGVDHNNNAEIRAALAPLVRLAEQRRLAILLVSHFNKGNLGPALYRSMGSIAFMAVARIAWAFIRDRDDWDRVLMLPLKNNLHRPIPGLAYRIVDGERGCRLEWEADPVPILADEAIEDKRSGKAPAKLEEAVDWLRDQLANGSSESKQLEDDAAEADISKATLWRARERLKVVATKIRGIKGGWMVSLPKSAEDPPAKTNEPVD
jgi:putative DNA primase/helicase